MNFVVTLNFDLLSQNDKTLSWEFVYQIYFLRLYVVLLELGQTLDSWTNRQMDRREATLNAPASLMGAGTHLYDSFLSLCRP